MQFEDLSLSDEVLDALYDMHFSECTPIQEQAIPLVLEGRDESIIRATKNIELLDDCYVNTLNVYDILRANKLIVTREAMENIQEVYA